MPSIPLIPIQLCTLFPTGSVWVRRLICNMVQPSNSTSKDAGATSSGEGLITYSRSFPPQDNLVHSIMFASATTGSQISSDHHEKAAAASAIETVAEYPLAKGGLIDELNHRNGVRTLMNGLCSLEMDDYGAK